MLNYTTLREKILGCFNGKNAGGALGAPFELLPRGIHDVSYYVQENIEGNPPPNDDLDLQLVWLYAAEKYGARVNSHNLAECWTSFITPDWAEYGAAKRNLAAGMLPPLSGSVGNIYRNSNGAWIRTEIWACLAPAHPDVAVRYAIEDAMVDHSEEGVYATAFCAALESAAFVCSDVRELLDIAATYLPENSACRDAVDIAKSSYAEGVDYLTCRQRILMKYTSSFGVGHSKLGAIKDEFVGLERPGFDAPTHVGFVALSLLYGDGDFEKTICIATNCGEDTDCTAGTVGAVYGIIYGDKAMPEKWMKPLGGIINTCCIELNGGLTIPKTTAEFTDRIMRLIPTFLSHKVLDTRDGDYKLTPAGRLTCAPECEYVPEVLGHNKDCRLTVKELLSMSPYTVRYEFFNFGVSLDYGKEPFVRQGDELTLTLYLHDVMDGSVRGHFANIRIYTDEGISLPLGNCISAPIFTTYTTKTKLEVPVKVEKITSPKMNVVFDISFEGRPTSALVKATLYAGGYTGICAKRPD